MVKLTEDMVVARSKGSDLHNVRKLNCWGSELSDVSVVRKLPNVEVLSLSVNQIQTLADFQYCPNLQELYIRKNSISDINEVLYLRQLPKLKSLWLADNPCADFEKYRHTVLRALPHLQKLDNVAVDSEEVQQAMVGGLALPISDSPMAQREEREMPRSSSMGESLRSEGGSSLSDCSPPSSERRYSQTTTPTRSNQQAVYDEDDEQPVARRTSYSQYQQSDPERRISQMSHYSNQETSPQQQYGVRRVSQQRQQEYSSPVENNQYHRRFSSAQQGSSGYYSSSSSTNGYHRGEADSSDRLRRTSYSSTQFQTGSDQLGPLRCPLSIHSPSRRSSQIVAEADSSDSRGYIRSPESRTHNADYEYDSRNANYLSREDTAPSRRPGQEQYRDQRWSDAEERERGYSRGDGYGYASPPSEVRQSPVGYEQRISQDPRYESRTQSRQSENGLVQQHYDNTYRRVEQQVDAASRSSAMERPSPTKPYPARPKTRNANVLSAVLCLIKELDYSSLEVVEMAVRCRMEELDD
ncbi:uncharacterized protein LOC122257586 isoform X2 [Penaeus japonicus]|uniref:uncharacterized protein LOC122257586 isoform X2 n=1 Tax=Penaeus japonicus TaxID=27405 RepID=UPI001C715278|nr:uncharacterized protein LOC122257586 isoform X2 [Penaeus japonicus]